MPLSLMDGMKLNEFSQQLQAVNGTVIIVRGETTLSARIGRVTLLMKCLVVDDVSEVLIGLDWLHKNVELLDFKYRKIRIGGELISLIIA